MELLYEKREHIALFTLNRPQVLNALDKEMFRQLHESFVDFSRDPELWVGVITGAGDKAFCAGVDINSWLPYVKECRDKLWMLPATPMRGMELDKPMIAALNGLAVGGGVEMALTCDLRVLADTATLGFPEARLGILPRMGGTARLPRLVGSAVAAEMMFTGKPISAQRALAIGLVNRVVPQDQVLDTALGLAEDICGCAPLAVRAIKKSLRRGEGMTLEEALWCESALGLPLYDTQDYEEGRRAFREKRPPRFKAR